MQILQKPNDLELNLKVFPTNCEGSFKGNFFTKNFKENNFFIQDNSPCLYLYRQKSFHGVYTGIIAGAAVDDYKDNKIKKINFGDII